MWFFLVFFFFFQAEDGIRDLTVTGVQTCALPISRAAASRASRRSASRSSIRSSIGASQTRQKATRSEEHTSELQSQSNLVCRLLLEKKKKKKKHNMHILLHIDIVQYTQCAPG